MGVFFHGQAIVGSQTIPTALAVTQPSTTGAIAVATLTQADTDQPFLNVVGTSGTGGTQHISTTASGTAAGHIQISVNGSTAWLRTYGTPT